MEVNLGFVLFAVLMAYLVVVRPVLGLLRDRKASLASEAQAEKAEALFRSTFPELQPHFHPARVADYVVARVEKGLRPVNGVIEKPPGFAAAARARVSGAPKGERTVLEDAAGKRIAEFTLEKKDGALGAVRLGAGKFTVRRKLHQVASVKYWHPEREFEWAPPANWKFQTRLADDSISSSDRGTTWSDNSSSSGRAATAAAAFAGAGGTFDGGGASAGWDGRGGADASPSADSGATASGDDPGAGGSGDDSATGAGGDSSGGSSDDASSTSY
jgi:uncharacterized membrane protein YgcG